MGNLVVRTPHETRVQYVRELLAGIKAFALTDPEAAASKENAVREYVLFVISNAPMPGEDSQALAALALTSNNIKFPRWAA